MSERWTEFLKKVLVEAQEESGPAEQKYTATDFVATENDTEKLRASLHRAALQEHARLSSKELEAIAHWEFRVEQKAHQFAHRKIAEFAKNLQLEIQNALGTKSDFFLKKVWSALAGSKLASVEYKKLTRDITDLQDNVQKLKAACASEYIQTEECVEYFLASLGMLHAESNANSAITKSALFFREKMITEFLESKITEMNLAIEKNILSNNEIAHQTKKIKQHTEFLRAEISLFKMSQMNVSDNASQTSTPRTTEIQNLLAEEELSLAKVESQRSALREEFDELAKQLDTLCNRLTRTEPADLEPESTPSFALPHLQTHDAIRIAKHREKL